jgi:diguanylate cyclase (GGDEF)-like protein
MCILIIADAVFLLAADFYSDFNSARQLPAEFYTVNGSVCLVLSVLLVIYIAFLSNRLITHDRAAEIARLNRLSFIANHDALTGILNRRTINMQLKACEARSISQDRDYAFTIFDIDDFKKFNDTYGHDCGDDILAEMTKAVSSLLPESASFARWGGEEFAILFNGNSAAAPQVLDTVRSKIADMRFTSRGRSGLSITLTFGLSMSGTGTPVRMMLIEADNNLMFGKRNGKNCVVTGNNVIFRRETAV